MGDGGGVEYNAVCTAIYYAVLIVSYWSLYIGLVYNVRLLRYARTLDFMDKRCLETVV